MMNHETQTTPRGGTFHLWHLPAGTTKGDMKRKLIPQFELPNAFTLDVVPTIDGDRIAAERAAEEKQQREIEAARLANEQRQMNLV